MQEFGEAIPGYSRKFWNAWVDTQWQYMTQLSMAKIERSLLNMRKRLCYTGYFV